MPVVEPEVDPRDAVGAEDRSGPSSSGTTTARPPRRPTVRRRRGCRRREGRPERRWSQTPMVDADREAVLAGQRRADERVVGPGRDQAESLRSAVRSCERGFGRRVDADDRDRRRQRVAGREELRAEVGPPLEGRVRRWPRRRCAAIVVERRVRQPGLAEGGDAQVGLADQRRRRPDRRRRRCRRSSRGRRRARRRRGRPRPRSGWCAAGVRGGRARRGGRGPRSLEPELGEASDQRSPRRGRRAGRARSCRGCGRRR